MKRKIRLTLGLTLLLLLSGCVMRPARSEPPAAAPTPSATPEPEVVWHTVSYRLDGEEIATERVAEGESCHTAPDLHGERAIIGWNNANGTPTDIWTLSIRDDMVFDGVLGPKVHLRGGFIAPESDGLFHPLDAFTRSDAVRAVYAILADKPTGETFIKDVTTRAKCWNAATALVTGGYIPLDPDGKFFPDAPITLTDLTALLEKIFSPGAVRDRLREAEEPLSRAEAARVLAALLKLDKVDEAPYYPDVAPDAAYYDAVELTGAAGEIDWIQGDKAAPGFVNLDGYLYHVRPDGYFLTDGMVGTLYFDRSGRFTSGNEKLDAHVAEIVASQTNAGMTREEKLHAVYLYVRDHYLYLKRNLYGIGDTGWEIDEALTMFETNKGNCYNFTAAFWALARGVGFDAVCYSGLVGVDRNPHSWVEITLDGTPYIYDVETEMQNRLHDDFYTSMYQMTYERGKLWSYAKEPYNDG